jgi:16S rRNA (cytosine1402-N4)-methyltransferase
MDTLLPAAGESVLDVTLGLGGHAEAFLERTGPDGHLTALDADTDNIRIAETRLAPFGDRVTIHHINFGQMATLGLKPFDIVFGDLGLSSPHLDDPSRGFSFRFDGPLDLRFDRTTGKTAAELLETKDVDDLIHIYRTYGELHREAGRLAHITVGKGIATTTDLKKAVENGFGFRAKGIMAQVFQALRIAVNEELDVLNAFLQAGVSLLKPGGRIGVLSYHSLEDRMVKQVFKALCEPEKDAFTGKISVPAAYMLLTKKAVQASEEEIRQNPRARSVKFRAIQRVLQ